MITETRRLRRVALLIGASCIVPAFLDAGQTYVQGQFSNAPGTPWQFIIFQGGEWIILGALTSIVYVLATRFPLRGERFARNIRIHVAGALALCVSWASLGVGLRAILDILPEQPLSQHVLSWLLTSVPWAVCMYFTVLGCVMAFAYFFEVQEREAQAARLSAQVAESRLDALRMQLHPHFLFNSLNAVAVLVRDGRATDATHVIEQLSEMLRLVLAEERSREIPLAEEVAFLKKYLDIEQLRFSDRLIVEWKIDNDVSNAKVPGFILQPLVENALRHGVAAMGGQTAIAITARHDGNVLELEVQNDAPDEASRERTRGRGVGLANARERLATVYGSKAELSRREADGRVIVTVRLPHGRVEKAQ